MKRASIKYKFLNCETGKYHQKTIYLDKLPTNEFHTVLHEKIKEIILNDIKKQTTKFKLINYYLHDGICW